MRELIPHASPFREPSGPSPSREPFSHGIYHQTEDSGGESSGSIGCPGGTHPSFQHVAPTADLTEIVATYGGLHT